MGLFTKKGYDLYCVSGVHEGDAVCDTCAFDEKTGQKKLNKCIKKMKKLPPTDDAEVTLIAHDSDVPKEEYKVLDKINAKQIYF